MEEIPLDAEAQAAQLAEIVQAPLTWKDAEAEGFYSRGSRGALKPLYGPLLEAFKAKHPYKMIADMKAVYVFNGTHYVDITPFEIRGFAEQKFNPKPEEKTRKEFHHKVLANNIDRRSFFVESTEGRLNFKNGVLDLGGWGESMEKHSAEYGFRGVLPYAYDPEATCPVFTLSLIHI